MAQDDQNERRARRLDWRDYVALFVALLQTAALPLSVLVVFVLVSLAVLSLLR